MLFNYLHAFESIYTPLERTTKINCACRCFQSVPNKKRRTLAGTPKTNASKGAAFEAEELCFVVPGNVHAEVWVDEGCVALCIACKGKHNFEKLMMKKENDPCLKHCMMRIFYSVFVFRSVLRPARRLLKAGSHEAFVGTRAVGQLGAGCVYCCTRQVPVLPPFVSRHQAPEHSRGS